MFAAKKNLIILFVLVFSVLAIKAQNIEELLPNVPFEREISENESHIFLIRPNKGSFFRVVIEQKNADVRIKLFDSGNQKIYEVDNSNSREEPERISFLAENADEFRLEISFVRKLSGTAAGQDYQINLETLRPATDTDSLRIKAERLYDQANLLRFQRDAQSRQNSLPIFQESAELFAEIGDDSGKAFAHYALGQINSLLSNWEESRTNHGKAAAIFRELNLRPQYARTITDQAAIYFFEGDLEKSEQLCLEALKIFEELGDRRGEAEITANLGAIYDNKDESRKALEYYFRALPILQAENDKMQEGSVLSKIGSAYDDLGEPFPALEFYEKALAVRRDLNDERLQAFTLANMSIVLKSLGFYERAIEANEFCYRIFAQIGQKNGVAACLNNLGNLSNDLNDNEKALEYYEKSLAINREIKARNSEAVTLTNIANIALQEGKTQNALKLFTESLQIFREQKNRRYESRNLMKIGETHLKIGEIQKSLECFNQALPIFREIEDRSWESATLFLIGEAHRKNKDFQTAKTFILNGLEIKRELQESSDETQSLLALAKIERDLNNLGEAQKRIEEAIGILENIRSNISHQTRRTSYFSAKQEFYEFHINLLVERHTKEPKKGFDALAFEASERARARNLLESLGESRFDIRAGVSDEILKKEKILRQTINAKDSQRLNALSAKQKEKAAEFEKELNKLLREYSDIQGKIRAESPRFAALTQPEILSLGRVQTEVLDEESVLLEYSLGEERSFLFVADKSSLEIIELPTRAEIEQTARQFVENIKAYSGENLRETPQQRQQRLKNADANWKRERETLSRILLGAVGEKLENKRLLIVASGVLQYIPFAALQVPSSKLQAPGEENQANKSQRPNTEDRFLIETNEIVSLPSASVLAVLRSNRRNAGNLPTSMAILADPVFTTDDVRLKTAARQKTEKPLDSTVSTISLPRSLRSGFSRLRFSRREAEEIAKLVPDNKKFIALDFSANLSAINENNFKTARYIHFATHGIINSDLPEISGIVLSLVDENGRIQDGFLRLHDIYNLSLTADLVVLSACESALGKEIRGEGIIGLTRGFMYAGAPSVAASLWKVDDRATSDLMQKFYQKMLRENLSPAESLRAAQISMIKDENFNHPFFWAAFNLQGDWQMRK